MVTVHNMGRSHVYFLLLKMSNPTIDNVNRRLKDNYIHSIIKIEKAKPEDWNENI